MIPPEEPSQRPTKKRWIPQEMTTAPKLANAPTSPIQQHYALLINPFYPKDPHASFGKHVLTPTLALTSFAAATPEHWRQLELGKELMDGAQHVNPSALMVGNDVELHF